MKAARELHDEWMQDSEYRQAYKNMESEFALASAIIEARKQAGLTQEQLAERMGIKQPYIARLEGGSNNPSVSTLERIAEATNSQLKISFEPRMHESA